MENIPNRKVNILVECSELLPSVKVGVLNALEVLEKVGYCNTQFKKTREVRSKDISWCDILVVVRGSESTTLSIAQAASKAGRYIVYFLDDDLLDVPPNIESWGYYKQTSIKENIKKILGLSNVLWCINPLIGEKYSSYINGNWIISKVPMDIEYAKKLNLNEGITKILYAGYADHTNDVISLLSPAVIRLCEEFGDLVAFTFIGVNPKLPSVSQVKFVPFIEKYSSYKAYVLNEGFDVGLAPLKASIFSQMKHYNKFLEYTSINSLGIYSDCLPYTIVVKDEENGLLSKNTTEDWYQCIRKAIMQPDLREICVKNARSLVKDEFSKKSVSNNLLIDMPQIISYHAPKVEFKEVDLKNSKIRYYSIKVKNIIVEDGVRSVPNLGFKIFRYIKKRAVLKFRK